MTTTAELVRISCPLCKGSATSFERHLSGFTLERCRSCQFVFVNPQLTSEELTRHYSSASAEAMIAHYDRVMTPAVIAEYDRTLARLERMLPGRGRMLELACGSGHCYEHAGKRGWEAHGADLGEWTLAATQARGLGNMHVGCLKELNFPDHHFDLVYAAQMLEHLPDPQAELAEVLRIVRPGGLLYVDVPNYLTLSIRLGRDDFWLNSPPEHLNYFAPRSLCQLLQQAGFQDMSVWTSGGLKWENLLGRRISREVAIAGSGGATSPLPVGATQQGRGIGKALRAAVKAIVVEPVFYRGLKAGMLLAAIARRP